MINYEKIRDTLYFGIDCEKYTKIYMDRKETLDGQTKHLSEAAKRVLIFMLSFARDGRPRYEDATYDRGLSMYDDVLARIMNTPIKTVQDGIAELIQHNKLEGVNPHWGIVNFRAYHHATVPKRKPIPHAIREQVLSVGICLHCGRTDRLSVDHIKPVSLGGGDDISNLQCLCLPCNISKLNRFIG